MISSHQLRVVAAATYLICGLAALPANAVVLASYNASLGTLPEVQGLLRFEDPGYRSPTVDGGILHTFPQTTASADQFWYTNDLTYDFRQATYVLEADLRIISSNQTTVDTGPRFGYYLDIRANDGRGYVVGITSTGVALDTDVSYSSNNDFVVTPFNTTDGFHHYSLVATNTSATLSIDGRLIASTSAGNAVFPIAYGAIFGDSTGVGISEAELSGFTVSAVPESTTGVMFALGLITLSFCRLQRRAV